VTAERLERALGDESAESGGRAGFIGGGEREVAGGALDVGGSNM
jgi:hypothetical protein